VRIKELNIKNFRIFKGKYRFDFSDKNLIIIYGNNGNGKSTIFDSIEWAMTGELLRYKGSTERNKFNYIFNNKVFGSKDCEVFVELVFDNDGQELRIKRICKCNQKGNNAKTKIFIDGVEYKEQDGSQQIRELLINNMSDEEIFDKGKFRDMFSATQLLSQDEIADFVSSKRPSDRLSVMEKILGVDRYGEDFREYIKNKISNLSFEIDNKKKNKELFMKSSDDFCNKIININTKISTIEEHNKNLGSKNENDILTALLHIRRQQVEMKFKRVLNIYSNINESVQAELLNSKSYIEDEVKSKDILLERVIRYKDDFDKNRDINLFKRDLEDSNTRMSNIIYRREKSIKIYENKINELETIIFAKNESNKYNEFILKNNEKINSIIDQINSLKKIDILSNLEEKYNNLETFKEKYIDTENEVKRLNNIIVYLNDMNEIEGLKIRKLNNKTMINDLSNSIIEIENSLVRIENNLSDKKDISGEWLKSISQKIFEIQNEIIEKRDLKICPLCGKEYEDISEFMEKVKNQLETSKKYFSNIENDLRELVLEKVKLEEERKNKQNKILDFIKEAEEIEITLNKKMLTTKSMDLESFNYKIVSEDYESLMTEVRENLKYNSTFINENKFAFEIVKNISNLENDLNELKEENKSYSNIKNGIFIKYNLTYKFMNKSNEEIISGQLKYKNYIFKANQSINLYNKEIAQNSKEISKYNKILNKLNIDRNGIIKDVGSFNDDEKSINIKIEEIQKDINTLKEIESNIKSILENINLLLSRDELNKLRENICELSKQKEEVFNKIKDLDNDIMNSIDDKDSLERILENSEEIQSELIAKLIENYSDFIDKLFFQISPHAFARHIYLIPRKTDLFIILSREKGRREELLLLNDEELKREANASLTLSSAQKNVLGICTFIALSLSQEWTKLDMMGIDDPFQNMDDINVYSFLDTLSAILDKKQVMISTHSEDFAALMSNKSILSKDKIKIIELETYSEDGVRYIERI
jgi:exonuclease SbcC